MTGIADLKLDHGYWYLATPYSKYPRGIEAAFWDACAVAGRLLSEGVHTYCPIAHTHPIAEYGGLDHYSHALFLPLDEQMMEHAHGIIVVMMPGWHESKGIAHELEWFETRGRPSIHIAWPIETPNRMRSDKEHRD